MLDVLNYRYVEVSFTETVKSTAPAFTLVLSSLLLGEIIQKLLLLFKGFNSQNVNLISRWKNHKDDEIVNFTSYGRACLMFRYWIIIQPRWFYFCVGYKYFWVVSILMLYHKHCWQSKEIKLINCFLSIWNSLQNVLSKKMLSLHKVKYNPGEIQYATGLASVLAQVPTFFLFATVQAWNDMTTLPRAFLYILNGIFFHFQTLSAYALMDAISPVTHSVANTLKRALLIWISVIVFKNHVTLYSGLGSAIVFIGVLLYNKARHQ